MKTFHLSTKEQIVVKKFKQQLQEKIGDHLIMMFLFGSKARGDYHKNSDIDVMVIIKKSNRQIINEIYNLAFDLMLETSIYLSIKIFDAAEYQKLNALPTVFMQKVRQEAIKV